MVPYHYSMKDARPKIKALIWDVDGVLVDTERLHFTAWQKLLEELGQTLTIEEYRPMIGRDSVANMATMCAAKGIAGNQAELTARRRAIYLALRQQGIPGMDKNVALLKQFAAHYPRLTQVAASNTIAAHVGENLKTAGVTECLKFFLSYQDHPDWRRKPAPDLYLAAIARLGLPATACLAFEDTEPGVMAAKAAGLWCVALPSVLTTGQNFSAADLVIGPDEPRSAEGILFVLYPAARRRGTNPQGVPRGL